MTELLTIYAETKSSSLESFNGIREFEEANGWAWGTITSDHLKCEDEVRDGAYLWQQWAITPPTMPTVLNGEHFYTV